MLYTMVILVSADRVGQLRLPGSTVTWTGRVSEFNNIRTLTVEKKENQLV